MKKKLVVIGIVIFAIAVGGYLAVRFGVGFVFDRYVLSSALSSVTENETTPANTLPDADDAEITEEKEQTDESASEQQVRPRLSNSEIISRVLRSSELTYKMASMVPYEDKRQVVQIILSNFTADELAEIAKNVSKGVTSEYKSKMIAEARSRLTEAQWQQCLNIAYKYIEKIRPYVE